jgi:hypothetical protein
MIGFAAQAAVCLYWGMRQAILSGSSLTIGNRREIYRWMSATGRSDAPGAIDQGVRRCCANRRSTATRQSISSQVL